MPAKQQSTFKEVEDTVPKELQQETVLPTTTASSTESETFNPPTIETSQPPVVVPQPTSIPEQDEVIAQARSILVNISKDHYTKILENMKKDVLRFEYIDSSGNVKADTRTYVPMTFGQNSKITKVLKRERLFREDVRAFIAGEEGALSLDELKKKYNDMLEDDTDEYDLKNITSLNEIIGNYTVRQKANIYWKIEDIENYSLNHMVVIQSLFESRNGFNPS